MIPIEARIGREAPFNHFQKLKLNDKTPFYGWRASRWSERQPIASLKMIVPYLLSVHQSSNFCNKTDSFPLINSIFFKYKVLNSDV